ASDVFLGPVRFRAQTRHFPFPKFVSSLKPYPETHAYLPSPPPPPHHHNSTQPATMAKEAAAAATMAEAPAAAATTLLPGLPDEILVMVTCSCWSGLVNRRTGCFMLTLMENWLLASKTYMLVKLGSNKLLFGMISSRH
uniref:Uncharacterized protein n=1 Tax=Aegilops tauschii subsp. strangulata TaxID=200361 RepID=A0A453GJW6_AEGTS